MQDEIKVDMDWRPPEDWLEDWVVLAMDLLAKRFKPKFTVEKITVETEKGYHIRLKLPTTIEDEECLRIQFLLGDDRDRCKLNYARWKAGIEDWNKLFKYKVKRK